MSHINDNTQILDCQYKASDFDSEASPIGSNVLITDCQATPGVTTWAGIRQADGGRDGAAYPLPLSPTITPETATPYLECGANRAYAKVCDWLQVNCGDNDNMWFVPGKCENGHRIAKVIACGKEWCPRCGQKGSIAHNRRIVRWLPKIQQFKRMRYIVFTIPESTRADFRSSGALRQLGRDIQELLKRHGFKRGLRRWHWFGDKSTKWHPHLNVLIEGGYMNGATLQGIKDGYKAILGVDTVSVRASYKPTPGAMVGCLSYVTRATFKDYTWDYEMALELMNFRNMVVWGGKLWRDKRGVLDPDDATWQLKEAKERLDAETGERIDVEAINNIVDHECPVCHGRITWDGVLPCRLLDTMITESLGAGYWRILDRKPPPLEDTIQTVLTFRAGAEELKPDAMVKQRNELDNTRKALRKGRRQLLLLYCMANGIKAPKANSLPEPAQNSQAGGE